MHWFSNSKFLNTSMIIFESRSYAKHKFKEKCLGVKRSLNLSINSDKKVVATDIFREVLS